RSSGAILTKFGRAPTTLRTFMKATFRLEPNDATVRNLDSPRGVARVDNEPGRGHDLRHVERGVLCQDDHTVGVRELLIGELDALQLGVADLRGRHPGIAVLDLCALRAEVREDLEGGRFPDVADVGLVRHAEREDGGAVDA